MRLLILATMMAASATAAAHQPVLGERFDDQEMIQQCRNHGPDWCVFLYGILTPPQDSAGSYDDGCERIDPETGRIVKLWAPAGGRMHETCDNEPGEE